MEGGGRPAGRQDPRRLLAQGRPADVVGQCSAPAASSSRTATCGRSSIDVRVFKVGCGRSLRRGRPAEAWQGWRSGDPKGNARRRQRAGEISPRLMWSFLTAGAAGGAPARRAAAGGVGTADAASRAQFPLGTTVSCAWATRFWMVPDSGSFEVVPSASCADCRCVHSASRCCTGGSRRRRQTTYAEPDGGASRREVDITSARAR